MPGGLVRVAEADGPVVSMQRGGRTKDAWVLWDEPVDTFSMLRPRNQPVQLQRAAPELAQPRRRQPILAGPLCRAVGIHCTPVAVPDDACPASEQSRTCLPVPSARLFRHPAQHSAEGPAGHPARSGRRTHFAHVERRAARQPGVQSGRVSARRRKPSRAAVRGYVAAVCSDRVRPNREYMLFVEYSAVLNGCLELLSAFSGMERENITRGTGLALHEPGAQAGTSDVLGEAAAGTDHAAR